MEYQETSSKKKKDSIHNNCKFDMNYYLIRAIINHFFLCLSLPLENIEPNPNRFAE